MALRQYRVRTPLRGVCAAGSSKGILTIPVGVIIAIVGDREHGPTYVTVRWNERELLVFPQDLSERTVECEIRTPQ